jgi:hypothetical protein
MDKSMELDGSMELGGAMGLATAAAELNRRTAAQQTHDKNTYGKTTGKFVTTMAKDAAGSSNVCAPLNRKACEEAIIEGNKRCKWGFKENEINPKTGRGREMKSKEKKKELEVMKKAGIIDQEQYDILSGEENVMFHKERCHKAKGVVGVDKGRFAAAQQAVPPSPAQLTEKETEEKRAAVDKLCAYMRMTRSEVYEELLRQTGELAEDKFPEYIERLRGDAGLTANEMGDVLVDLYEERRDLYEEQRGKTCFGRMCAPRAQLKKSKRRGAKARKKSKRRVTKGRKKSKRRKSHTRHRTKRR